MAGAIPLHAQTNARAQTAPLDRLGSGTSWIPLAFPMTSHETGAGKWTIRLHGALFAGLDAQSGPRGDTRAGVSSWIGAAAHRDVGAGRLSARASFSLDAPGLTNDGMPHLLQTGDAVNGVTSHDRQTPREFFRELSVAYDVPVARTLGVAVYAAAAGEPALGPSSYMMRPSAADNPVAPLDRVAERNGATSFGVVTAGIFANGWKFEASRFNGRAPNEHRFNIERLALDSYSARLTMYPEDSWTATLGGGHVQSPNPLEPDVSMTHFAASLMNARKRGGGSIATTLVYTANKEIANPRWAHGLLLESEATLDSRNTLIARAERIQKRAEDLGIGGDNGDSFFGAPVATITALTGGYIREVFTTRGTSIGAGATATLNIVPSEISGAYGSRTPAGMFLFLRVRPIE